MPVTALEMFHLKEIKAIQSILIFFVSFIFFVFVTACEKTDYDLLDPDSAGVWTLFTTKDGLPENQVTDIKLDTEGQLWLAFSENGVASYLNGALAGYNTSNSYIISDFATSLAPVSDGSILIGTADGISLRTVNDQWSNYKDPEVSSMHINAIKIASNGIVWAGTEGQCLYINEGSGFYHLYDAAYENVNIIEEDSYNNIWIGTDNGLLKWDGSNFSLLTTSEGLPENEITALCNDSKGRLWIGTSGGETVSWIDNSGLHQLSLMTGNEGIYVQDIIEDRRGDIWFATWFDGLVRYDGVISHSFKIYNGFYENDVNTIGEDSEGNLWFGLYSKGLVKYTLPLE
jgi:ligand-binding sensor domain-containing protein